MDNFEEYGEKMARMLASQHEARQRLLDKEIPREDASTSEGVKALLAINGGGIVAMLGFMQALIKQDTAIRAFRDDGCTAMLFFAVGVVLAAIIPALRVIDINNTLLSERKHPYWEWALYASWVLSVTSFIVATCFVAHGIRAAI